LEWSDTVYGDNGDRIQRRRIFPTLSGEAIGAPGKRIQMNRIEIEMATGLGTASGDGYDPEIYLEVSTDGGHSWTGMETVKIGNAGEFDLKVECYHCATFRRATFRLTQTDPVLSNITSAAVEIQEAGW